jgi:hypothetical protein
MILDVYLIFDLGPDIDIDIIEKCIKIYLLAKLKCNVHVCQNVTEAIVKKGDIRQYDIIKRGLHYFSEAYKDLKLKSTNKCWFIYISNGKISGFTSNVSLILLSKNPGVKECSYVISKRLFNVLKESDKSTKLEELKVLTRSLTEVVSTTKTIRYK